MKALAVLVVAALALLCLGDVAQAFLSADAAPDCFSRMCSETGGCGAPDPPALVLVVTQAAADVTVPPASGVVGVAAGAPEKPLHRPVFQLAPRSPPTAS
jgi:hypothetical protein